VSSSTSDTVYGIKTPSELVRQLRIQHGLSQRELAYRAGTSQSAIARIEAGDEDITWKRLSSVLAAMGDRPVLDSTRLPHRYELGDLLRERAMSPETRLMNAVAFNRFGSELAIAGAKAKAKAKAKGRPQDAA
jgi:transcriptional regulator with XRE-family HTH domain